MKQNTTELTDIENHSEKRHNKKGTIIRNSLTIKEWEDEDKPREKLMTKGKKELSNAELLGILIGSGIQGTTAVDLAKEILRYSAEGLTPLTQMEASDFKKFNGIGTAKAVTLIAALELGRRMSNENANNKDVVITNSETLYNYIHTQIDDLNREKFMVVYLNSRGKILGTQCISYGGIAGTLVDLRTLFKYAVELNAVSIAMAHNHPSGNLRPSKEDEHLTNRIVEAGKLLDVRVLDHLIVGLGKYEGKNYYSFRDYGRI